MIIIWWIIIRYIYNPYKIHDSSLRWRIRARSHGFEDPGTHGEDDAFATPGHCQAEQHRACGWKIGNQGSTGNTCFFFFKDDKNMIKYRNRNYMKLRNLKLNWKLLERSISIFWNQDRSCPKRFRPFELPKVWALVLFGLHFFKMAPTEFMVCSVISGCAEEWYAPRQI